MNNIDLNPTLELFTLVNSRLKRRLGLFEDGIKKIYVHLQFRFRLNSW